MAEPKLEGMYEELYWIMMIENKYQRVVRYRDWVKLNKGDSI